ncbi:heme-binding protein [Chthoniobacter flavus Ellin428]|uniref:Heme-binding protein n=1 Tax=Chthoniobacter flavus Ellin428 TaxID=497964 RepID=B4D134_9BACT|nr:c-type cytochrome [Chthoniobacter flavus]EDY20046.1 heme-binding protein [Chthoniobacter flavus Ellin428]TCO93944.1 putative heme-binding domain-containing protein [Chthoniobacter flavus]
MSHRFALSFLCGLTLALPASAQKKGDQLPERSEAEILKTVTLPEGYEATVFAKPPMAGYPTSVSAAPDGTLFVAVDENGSLGRDRNEAGKARGKVLRLRDTKGTGHADEVKTFCEVESPRGVIWDGPKGDGPGVLYVMHPPNLTAYYDDTGEGKATRQKDILTGLGFDLGFRGADHTTNGCRLAIDGYIYIAMGDYGCINAKGTDGRTLTHRGGGVVRIRPDGTGLELFVEGTRNIYDVSVTPTLDVFTRDNTNDGGGWNDRLSFHPPGAHMGYPMLFKNFNEDMIETMADFGGGSPCGSIWIDEPGLPKGLFTVEWGVGGIFYHDDLVQNGAGYKLTKAESKDPRPAWERSATPQKKWLALTRPTDIDVDASGRLYITSWEGATFNYNGPYAGYVLEVKKKDAPKVEVPDLTNGDLNTLLKAIASPSAVLRLAAQRQILAGKYKLPAGNPVEAGSASGSNYTLSGPVEDGLLKIVADKSLTIGARVAALETFGQKYCRQERSVVNLAAFLKVPELREFVLEELGDENQRVGKGLALSSALTEGLSDANPRVRLAAMTSLRRLDKTETAPAVLPLVADADPIIAHVAFRTLRAFKAIDVCLNALDSADEKVKSGALKALYGIYDPKVVDGLIQRLSGAQGEERRGILNALCRLANEDAPYESPTVWWSTRPDTTGPVYQPISWSETDKISAALKKALDASNADDSKWLVQRMYQCKVAFPGLVELMLQKAGSDTPAKLTAIEGMVRNDKSMPPEAIKALQEIVSNDKEAPELRVRGLRIFTANSENGTVFPGAVEAFAPLAGHDLPDAKLTQVFEDFTRGGHNAKWVNEYNSLLHGNAIKGVVVAGATGTAQDTAREQRRQLAATVLVNLATGRVGRQNEREAAKKDVEKSFDKPETAAALLHAIARSGAKPLAELVKANLNNPNNAVAEAALFAYQKLGLKDTGVPQKLIGSMTYDEIFAGVQKGGDAKEGQQMFLKAGCIACHTINPDEPPKGPILSAVVKIYDRATLTESILKPSAKIAQGFESQWFKTKKGEQIEGFVTREGGDSVDVRNIAGQAVTLEKADIAERGKRDKSIMPEGLLNSFTITDLQNLLAWLESLRK